MDVDDVRWTDTGMLVDGYGKVDVSRFWWREREKLAKPVEVPDVDMGDLRGDGDGEVFVDRGDAEKAGGTVAGLITEVAQERDADVQTPVVEPEVESIEGQVPEVGVEEGELPTGEAKPAAEIAKDISGQESDHEEGEIEEG